MGGKDEGSKENETLLCEILNAVHQIQNSMISFFET